MATLKERLMAKVEKTQTCWLWRGARTRSGHGLIGAGDYRGNIGTHRASWELENGPIPQGLWVLHRCDIPNCVNPAHLYLGTRADNARDVRERGKPRFGAYKHGEKHWRSRLNAEQVTEIKSALVSGTKVKELAKKYNVNFSTIADIKQGRTWSRE